MLVYGLGHKITRCFCLEVAIGPPFGYGWISDTKFLKFLDKDWVGYGKNFSHMDQE